MTSISGGNWNDGDSNPNPNNHTPNGHGGEPAPYDPFLALAKNLTILTTHALESVSTLKGEVTTSIGDGVATLASAGQSDVPMTFSLDMIETVSAAVSLPNLDSKLSFLDSTNHQSTLQIGNQNVATIFGGSSTNPIDDKISAAAFNVSLTGGMDSIGGTGHSFFAGAQTEPAFAALTHQNVTSSVIFSDTDSSPSAGRSLTLSDNSVILFTNGFPPNHPT